LENGMDAPQESLGGVAAGRSLAIGIGALLTWLGHMESHPPPLWLRRELQESLQIGKLLDFRWEDCGFGDVVSAGAHGAMIGGEDIAASAALGDLFPSHFPFADDLEAKRAVPPPSDAEQRRIKVLPQFSTIVWASAWP
jgi:hypothetical protein